MVLFAVVRRSSGSATSSRGRWAVPAPDAFAALAQNSVAMPDRRGVLGYLICALAFGVVVRMYLRRDVWARVVASTVVYNLAAADNVVARGDTANALGEGFADSLDIGGF